MDYEHDIFLSYANGPEGHFGQWVRTHFLRLFKVHLIGALGKTPAIFLDRQGIDTGETWPLKLKQALAQSRCMVAIWSPAYFESQWCQYEHATMLAREQQLGYRTAPNPRGLIVPVTISDGAYFPQQAQHMQQFDCREYMRISNSFESTPKYNELEDRIVSWVPEVAQVIAQAPDWQASWLQIEEQLPQPAATTFDSPVLE